MQSSLHKGLNGTVFLLPALTLVVDRSIGAVALVMLVLAVALLRQQRNPKLLLQTEERALLYGMCAYPVAVALGSLVHHGWEWSDFDHASRFLLVLPIYFAIRRFGAHRGFFYSGLMVGAVGAGAFGFYQKYVQGLEVAHGYIHKISFGDISLMLGVLSLTYIIRPEKGTVLNRWIIVAALLAFLFGLIGSVTSGTRGGWVAVPFMLWAVLHQALESKRLRYGLYAIFVIGAVGIYHTNQLVQFKVDKAVTDTRDYFSENRQVRGSAGTRFEMWRAAGMMFVKEPVFGVGYDEYREALKVLVSEKRVHWMNFGHAHNEFLTALAELGLVGAVSLMLFYGLVGYFFYQHLKVDRRLATAGLLLCFGYLDFGLTQAMLRHNITTLFLVSMVVILAGLLSHARRSSSVQSEEGEVTAPILPDTAPSNG